MAEDESKMGRGRSKRSLAVTVTEDTEMSGKVAEHSYNVEAGVFIKDNIAINATGVFMKDNAKAFTCVPEELVMGDIIGRGSSSYVQRAVHKPSGTPLALKVLNMFEKGKRDQLIKEIQALYNANCDCLVSFYGAFHREGAITIALEYMDGGALSDVLKAVGTIPESVLANMTFQILWGLGYLKHEKRLHRDLKPSNLLVNSKGQCKLTDFGVSTELQNSMAMCATFVGTFKYMSPERILHNPYSYPSDIWALGLILIEAATGVYPYDESDTVVDMVETIISSDAPKLPADKFTKEFCEFVSQCVQKKAETRLPPDILLGSPWLKKHGAIGLKQSVANVKLWVDSVTGGSGK